MTKTQPAVDAEVWELMVAELRRLHGLLRDQNAMARDAADQRDLVAHRDAEIEVLAAKVAYLEYDALVRA